jgi:hypothetical protein
MPGIKASLDAGRERRVPLPRHLLRDLLAALNRLLALGDFTHGDLYRD